MKLVTFTLFAAIAVTFVSAKASPQPEKAIETGAAGPQNLPGSSQSTASQQEGLSANRFEKRQFKPFQHTEDKKDKEVLEKPDESVDDDDEDCIFCCESSGEQEPLAETGLPPNKPNGNLSAQLPAPFVNAM